MRTCLPRSPCRFQLTPSRRATANFSYYFHQIKYFNSRPHGGRQAGIGQALDYVTISTHALTEGDRRMARKQPSGNISTHALTEGDGEEREETVAWNISTHALTEGDQLARGIRALKEHFNSRPHGGRQQI